MNEMNANNRDYDNRDYNNRGYDNRYYDEGFYDNRADYRGSYRDDYRTDYREDYRRDYDRRGGRMNNRNYREHDYYGELEMITEDMRQQYRKLEDVSEMAHNAQDKNMIMKIAQKERENYMALKQMAEKQM